MIGMSFFSFLVLLGIGAIVALMFHYIFRYRFLDGMDSVFAKIVLGWVGAWVGSPVFGYWSYKFENIYIVPAILGSMAAVMLNVVAWKAFAKALAGRPAVETFKPGKPGETLGAAA